MSVVRVVFMGTPEFARESLQSLLEDEHFEVVGVVSQPDRPAGRKMKMQPSQVKAFAESKGLKVITPEKVSVPEVMDEIRSWKAEAAVVVAYGQILSQDFLDMFPQKIVNVHASLLPRWRGAAPIQRAIMEGDAETGVSLQVMVYKLDAGDVLGERKIKIDRKINAIELHDKLKLLGSELLHVELMDYLRGNLQPHAQDRSQVTYAAKIEKSEGLIDWSQTAQVISCRLRGLAMGPGAFSWRSGKKLKVHQVEVIDDAQSNAHPGDVVAVSSDNFDVACGQGVLRLLVVQPESKARQTVSEYLKGYPIAVGESLGNTY